MHETATVKFLEVRSDITFLLVSRTGKNNQAAVETKLNWLEFVVHVAGPAANTEIPPIDPPGLCVDDCSHQTRCAAAPGSQNVVAGKVWFFSRRFSQPGSKHPVLMLQNQWGIRADVGFRNWILLKPRQSLLWENFAGYCQR